MVTVLSGFHCIVDLDLSLRLGYLWFDECFKKFMLCKQIIISQNKGYFWILSGRQNFKHLKTLFDWLPKYTLRSGSKDNTSLLRFLRVPTDYVCDVSEYFKT